MFSSAWSGDSFSNRIWKNNSRLAQAIRSGCRGIVMGLESPTTIKKRLMKDLTQALQRQQREYERKAQLSGSTKAPPAVRSEAPARVSQDQLAASPVDPSLTSSGSGVAVEAA